MASSLDMFDALAKKWPHLAVTPGWDSHGAVLPAKYHWCIDGVILPHSQWPVPTALQLAASASPAGLTLQATSPRGVDVEMFYAIARDLLPRVPKEIKVIKGYCGCLSPSHPMMFHPNMRGLLALLRQGAK